MPLEKSLDSSEIGKAIQKRIMTMPALRALVSEVHSVETQTASPVPSDASTTENVPVSDNMEYQASSQLETPRTKYRRQNAALQIIETDVAQNVSQVSPALAAESAPELNQAPYVEVLNPLSETRLDIGMPKLSAVEQNQRPNLPSLKRDKGTTRNATSASMRKALKAGNRRWIDLRKTLFVNHKQVAIVVLFVVCISLIGFLMSGDDDDVAIAAKPLVEDISLPHVRVNPSLVSANSGRGRALNDVHNYGVHRNDED